MSETEIEVLAKQNDPTVNAEGVPIKPRATRDGVPFTATWKQALLLEGRCFTASFGEMGATDITALTAGLNLDQPDFCVSVPAGTSLIPLKIVMAAQFDADADADDAFLIVMADIDAAYAADGTVTSVTAYNCISSGGVTGVATVFEDASADITDPTVSKIMLDCAQMQVGVAGSPGVLKLDYEPEVPFILDGPAAIYGYGGGATDPPKWAGYAIWAEVPTTRYAVG